MNYRVIIADDETKILQLIRLLGKWDEYGIEIVDECHDGRATLESIKRKSAGLCDFRYQNAGAGRYPQQSRVGRAEGNCLHEG